jgi:hypothetical protein
MRIPGLSEPVLRRALLRSHEVGRLKQSAAVKISQELEVEPGDVTEGGTGLSLETAEGASGLAGEAPQEGAMELTP